MNLEDITLSEASQKDKYCEWFQVYDVLRVVRFIEIDGRIVAARGVWGHGERKVSGFQHEDHCVDERWWQVRNGNELSAAERAL